MLVFMKADNTDDLMQEQDAIMELAIKRMKLSADKEKRYYV